MTGMPASKPQTADERPCEVVSLVAVRVERAAVRMETNLASIRTDAQRLVKAAQDLNGRMAAAEAGAARLEASRRRILEEGARAQRIVAEAQAIAGLIDAGDLEAMERLRASISVDAAGRRINLG